MAIAKKKDTATSSETTSPVSRLPQRNNQRAPILGYLNITVTDKNGKVHHLPKGIPLDGVDRVTRSILAKAEANPECELTLTGTVNMVDDNDENIEL